MATLSLGDLAFTGYQASSTDKASFVLLKAVDSGTVLTVSDNAWTGSALSTSEGNSVITFGGSFTAGTQFNYDASRASGLKWAVGTTTSNLSDVTSGNFALNASGDNLFAYNGSVPPTTGNGTEWVSGFATNAFLTSGASSTSLTYLPSVFASTNSQFSLGLANGASNENGIYSGPDVTGTADQIRTAVYNVGNWTTFTTAGAQTIPPAKTFTIQASNNNAPTGLSLSNNTILENAGANAVVGAFSSTDPDSGNTFTYSFVAGTGSTDNTSFNISGNSLRANAGLDFETKSSYSVRVRTTDQGGLFFEQVFSIQVIDVNESVNLKLNELKVNPPGSATGSDKYQYVELLGSAGLSLNNVYVVMLDGNGPGVGTADYVANLSGQSLGSNGLLMIKSPSSTGTHSAASGTTVVTDTQFDTPGGILSKQTLSFYLVSSSSTIVQGTDFDLNDDGVLDNLPGGFTIFDNVGWSDGDSGDRVYGGVSLTQTQGTPDAATRIVGNSTTAFAAWYNGDLYDVGNIPSQLLYDETRGSANLPITPTVASLTPGDSNFVDLSNTTTNLRIASYNITSWDNLPRTGLGTILEAIGTHMVGGISRQIDVLALQEIDTAITHVTQVAVANLLNSIYGAAIYAYGTLVGDSTGSGTQGVVYNTQTVQLLGEAVVGTSSLTGQPRQTLRHHFQPIGGGSSTDFYIYNSHWKAADDADGRNRRLIEADAIRANADALGNGKNIIYVGDFNLYDSSELAFTEMVGAGFGQAFDPINRVGNWHNNASYTDVMTQAPANTPPSGLTGGGLDDRFDFQLVTGELTDGLGLEYRAGSYQAFGNNGSVPLNGDINSPNSTALSGLANQTTVLNFLTTVSDHLPVVADYTLTSTATLNQAPSGTDTTVATDQDVQYTFAATDFGFSDPNNVPTNSFDSVKITATPSAGSLLLNGVPVSAGQFVAVSAISAGNLKFAPATGATGSPYATFTFQVRDNGGTTNGGIDLDPTPNAMTINVLPIIIPAVRINEALVNPSDTDDAREFVELLRLSPSESLTDVWLLEVETDSVTGRGIVDHALNLSTATFGSNDLLLIGDNYETSTPYTVPVATGRFNLNRPTLATIENSANLLLVYKFTGAVGVDYDTNDDGVFDSAPWTSLIDSVGIAATAEPAYVVGSKIQNSDNSGVVDSVVRFPGVTTAFTSAAFYGGEILDTGTNALDLNFQTAPSRTSNFPTGGMLTPGAPNDLLATPSITITSGNSVYNNSGYIATASISGNNLPLPSLTYEFYSDAGGTTIISAPENVGTYYVRASTAANAGNNASQSAITQFTITTFALTASGTASDKIYDATTATMVNISLTGVFVGDTVTGSAFGAFVDKNAGAGKTVTIGGVTLGGADAANYTVGSAGTTTADITAKAITGSITAANKVFDGNTSATILTRTLSGAELGDDVSYVGGTATFASATVGTGIAVTATGLGLSGTEAGNYTVNTTAATTANITAAASIVNRRVFYNGGSGGATGFGASTNFSATAGNPPATAIDSKVALLPGQNSSFANYTNVSFGLNGIIVDIANPTGTLTAADFTFAKGETLSQSGFVAFTPTELSTTIVPVVTQYVGGGVGGSTRAKITFNNNSLKNTWVKVTVLANANTGLAANDVFYFGNVVGDTQGSTTGGRYTVNSIDTSGARNNQSSVPNSVLVTNIYDFNKTGNVNSIDTSVVRTNQQASGFVKVISGAQAMFVGDAFPRIDIDGGTVNPLKATLTIESKTVQSTYVTRILADEYLETSDPSMGNLFVGRVVSVEHPTNSAESIDDFFAELGNRAGVLNENFEFL